jgi:hypothetical protein
MTFRRAPGRIPSLNLFGSSVIMTGEFPLFGPGDDLNVYTSLGRQME